MTTHVNTPTPRPPAKNAHHNIPDRSFGGLVQNIINGLAPGEPLLSRAGVLPGSPRPGYVRIGVKGSRSLDLALTGEVTVPSAGGNWQTAERQDDVEIPYWPGGKLLRLDMPVQLNGIGRSVSLVQGDPSIEEEWRVLEQMWRPPGGDEPPVLSLTGPIPHQDRQWVLDDIAIVIDEAQGLPARNDDGHLVLQEATLHFLQWISNEVTQIVKPTAAQAARDKPTRIYTKAGDTLRTLARQYLGDARKWTKIRDANKLYSQTAGHPFPARTPLLIPPKSK